MRNPLARHLTVKNPQTVGAVTLAHGVNEFFSIVIPPILPLIVTDLGVSYTQGGLLLTVFFVMYSIFQLPAGIIADQVGKHRLMIGGLVLMGVGIAIAGQASGYPMLVLGQAIAGIGGSTFHPTGMSMISDDEDTSTHGRAMGIFGFGGALGTLSAPLLIGGIAVFMGWQAALVGGAFIGIGVTGMLALLVSRQQPVHPGGEPHRPRLRGWSSDLPRSPAIIGLFLMTLLLSAQHRAIQAFTTSYIAAGDAGSLSVGNLTFFALLVGGSIASVIAGDLADRIDRPSMGAVTAIMTALLVVMTLGLPVLLADTHPVTRTLIFAGWFAAIGAMTYASYPVKNALIAEWASRGTSGSLFGIMQTASAIGSALGPALIGILADWAGIAIAFPAIAAMSALLVVMFLWLRRQ
jgi:MFS family permease